jgi:hypothetical protein
MAEPASTEEDEPPVVYDHAGIWGAAERLASSREDVMNPC